MIKAIGNLPLAARRCTPSVARVLPAASISNVGMYGTGQAYEALLIRMRAHPLPEARKYAALMLDELRKVIPSFLTRVDRPDRGSAWSAYLAELKKAGVDRYVQLWQQVVTKAGY